MFEHTLDLQGQKNCRDLGGYIGHNNQKIIRNHLIRSGHLSSLSQPDIRYLNALPILSIVDFRSEEEQEKQPNVSISSVQKNLKLPIDTGNLSINCIQGMVLEGDVLGLEKFFIGLNQSLALDSIAQYRQFFQLLQEKKTSIVFHCTAGKDRTGLASALLLSALGVDENIILQDYLISNLHTEALQQTLKQLFHITGTPQKEALNVLLSVKATYLQAAFNSIHEHYGPIEHYLSEALDVDIHRMRALYLEQ